MKWTKIGSAAVDSGQLMICDPCYLDDFKGGEFDPDQKPEDEKEWSYNSVCHMTCGEPHYGQVNDGTAVVFSSGYGDGLYPVYAEISNGRIVRIMIDMC